MAEIRILTPEELEARAEKLTDGDHVRRQHQPEHIHNIDKYEATVRDESQTSGSEKEDGASFEQLYPNVAYFVTAVGRIEVGSDDQGPLTSLIRALDPGGMVWEGKDTYTTLDEAFQDLEQGLAAWMQKEGLAGEE